MRTIWIDQWRRGRRRVELLADLPDTPARNDGPEAVASRVTLDQALARLSRGQRLVLVLRFYEDLPEQRVADEMGVRVGTVKSQTRHALNRLRTLAPELAEAFDRVWADRELTRR